MRHLTLLLAASLSASPLWAESASTLTIAQVWQAVEAASEQVAAQHHQTRAQAMAQQRAALHWAPTLRTSVSSLMSDDPGATLFSWMGQGELLNSDLSAGSLNDPGAHLLHHATVSLDMPLFEGGSKVAQVEAMKHWLRSEEIELQRTRLERYIMMVNRLARMVVVQGSEVHLSALESELNATIKNYQLGRRDNPLGYSGMLGLQGVSNRLQIVRNQNRALLQQLNQQIKISAPTLPATWHLGSHEIRAFLPSSYDIALLMQPPGESLAVEQARVVAAALEQSGRAQWRQRLPRLGLLAQSDWYGGGRGAMASGTVGAYLQWEVFTPSQKGVAVEAQARHQAAWHRAMGVAMDQQEATHELQQNHAAFIAALQLLDSSDRLLTEQTKVSRQLFRNGTIQALQLSEVMARRLDQLLERRQVEFDFSANFTKALQLGVELP